MQGKWMETAFGVRWPRGLIGALALCTAGLGWAEVPAATDTAAWVALGQRIYREAVDTQGQTLRALGPSQIVMSGTDVACTTCHRRSGYGTAEGKYTVRPITGPALFQEQTMVEHAPRVKAQVGMHQRAAYTEATLARALRTGMDAAGKPLESIMPRYALSDNDVRALSAYLATLSAQDAPGVDAEEVHFATVIQPGVSPERRRAMLDIMQAFVRDKTSNVRSDEQRREAGIMRMNRSYRKWVLDVWELTGPAQEWPAQLDAHYRRQPVFALVGGLGASSWAPIHDFAERLQLPCVLPQVDLPAAAGSNAYTVYFSRGLALEAEVLARHLQEQAETGLVVQVYRPTESASAAARAFRAALPSGTAVQDVVLTGAADAAFWRGVLADRPAQVLLWLEPADWAALPTEWPESSRLLGSYALLGNKGADAVVRSGKALQLVYPSDLPPRHDARMLRAKMWLHNKGIGFTDEATQVNTLFAMAVVSDAMGHIMDSFSRDFFLERVEHAVSQTPTPSLYQSISLGPGQRYAAKGSNIVQWGEKGPVKAVSGWVVP